MKHTFLSVLFALVIGLCGPKINAQSITTGPINTPICAGGQLSVPFTITGTFVGGNVFTAQLSDDTGSFSNPINIGTLSSTSSGLIPTTIPANSITDTGYRIRVVSSSPAIIGSVDGNNITIHADTPSITIGASGTTLCPGTTITLRATTVNGGPTPSYEWQKNGNFVGTDTAYYTDTALVNDDVITCILTSDDACATTVTAQSNYITLTVSPVDTPVVTIVTSQNDTICKGTSLTFTAIPMYGGSTPTFQWKVNGQNTGSNSSVFTSDSLTNNDVVNCVLTSNAPCITQSTAMSNSIKVTVYPIDTPAISITASQTSICGGNSVTFTAHHSGGGTAPVYQWIVNSNNVGGDSSTYTTSSLSNHDVVSCLYTSNAACASPRTAFANNITMTVVTGPTPTIHVSTSRNNICSGAKDTLTATVTNQGTAPYYQWKINGHNVGLDSSIFIFNGFTNNDSVSCILISNSGCASQDTVTSNKLGISVITSSTPTINITATHTNICLNSSSTFTATAFNGGPSPVYQWFRSGNIAGGDSITYTDNNLSTGESVYCLFISDALCATTDSALSNTINITDSVLTPAVSITATQTTICTGSSITFTATPVFGGTSPAYQWKKNNANVGTNSATYTDNNLSNGEVISCVLTSNSACLTTNTAHSNSITITDSAVTPIVRIQATETSICPGTYVVFTAYPSNGGNSPTYQWKLNGQNVGGDTTFFSSSSLNNNDVITCVLVSSVTCANNDTANSNILTMTVHAPVIPGISISPSLTAACSGTNITFTSTIANGGSSPLYIWKRNGVFTGSNTSNYTTNSLYSFDSVTCVLVSNALCAFPDSVVSNAVSINIYPAPSVTITPSGIVSFCKYDSISLQASSDSLVTYLWSTGATTQTVTINSGESVVVTVTNANNCAATSQPVTVVQNPLPSPSISQSLYTLVSTPASSYQWYLNDTLLSGDTAQTFDYILPGNYQVEVTDSLGCSNISDIYTVYSVGIHDISQEISVKVYPNPNSGEFKIEFGDAVNKQFEISDITGKIIWPETEANKQYEIKMPSESSGLYFLKVTQNKKVATFKILITQ